LIAFCQDRTIVAPRLMAAASHSPCVLADSLRHATARLTPTQRAGVEAHAGLSRLFLALDVLGPKGAPGSSIAARIGLMSRTTLWRLFIANFGCTYFQFVRRWRVDVAEPVYRNGTAHLRQDVAAVRSGLGNRARMRAAFLACRGRLPTGRASPAVALTLDCGLPLFAASG
jgi:transcriptional regulator GlxA family with amidase domain